MYMTPFPVPLLAAAAAEASKVRLRASKSGATGACISFLNKVGKRKKRLESKGREACVEEGRREERTKRGRGYRLILRGSSTAINLNRVSLD